MYRRYELYRVHRLGDKISVELAMGFNRRRLIDVTEDDSSEDGAASVGVLGHHDDAYRWIASFAFHHGGSVSNINEGVA